ncbi:LysR family transcriptional regulator [Mycolicibacterium litorale]|nr:LysR family transcriptional regulator [Mycolicibacterium litorale]
MPKCAGRICENADMSTSSARPSADDLLVLLAVGRSGRFVTAAEEVGLNHTTISRRIAALEHSLGGRVLARVAGGWELTDLGRDALVAAENIESAVRSLATGADGTRTLEGVVRLSATDGFSAYIAAPAAAQVQRHHPRVSLEIVTATRRASQHRSGLDIEVVVGEPRVRRAIATRLGDYRLGLYGSRSYLAQHGTPESVTDLARYPLVYFIDAMLQVDDLDLASSFVPAMHESVTSTNVFVHVEATRADAGLGLLPCFMADRHDDLVRVLPEQVAVQLSYWLVTRKETLRRPEVAAVVEAITLRMRDQHDVLLGRSQAEGTV